MLHNFLLHRKMSRWYHMQMANISQYLATISKFCTKVDLCYHRQSSVSLFTSWTNEVRMELDIYVNAYPRHTEQSSKSPRSNLLRNGKRVDYNNVKAIGCSLLNYAAPVWSSFLGNTKWRVLPISQNNAHRITTGILEWQTYIIFMRPGYCNTWWHVTYPTTLIAKQ